MPIINQENRTVVGTLTAGATISSNLSVVGEKDLYQVSLVAGRTYTFALNGDASASASGIAVSDTYLTLYKADGTTVLSDDDSGDGANSTFSYTPSTSGTFYVEARAFGNYYAGGYNLSVMAQNSAPVQSGTLGALASATVNSPITLLKSTLLQGYTDPDGDSLSVGTISLSNGGALTALANGTGWTYQPTVAGSVQVNYEISDGRGASVVASNAFTVNAAAAANAITLTQVGNSSRTSEDGGTVTYNISLNNALTAGSLTLALTARDATEGRFLVGSQLQNTVNLTFSAGGSQTQTVVVKGIQDYENDGSAAYTFTAKATTNAFTPATSGTAALGTVTNWTTAIRDFNGGTATTSVKTVTLYNDGDTDAQGRDRDVALYLVGDESRAREDILIGNDGADRLYGGYMIDSLYGGIGSDRVYGGYEDDQLYGGAGDDQLYGEQDDDLLMGGDGNDRLDGGIGADTMAGGAGNDVYYVTLGDDGAVEDVIDESAATGGAGTDTIYIPFQVESYVAPVGVENIRMNAGFGDTAVTGNASNNGLYGNAGDNRLDGGVGADTLSGGAGADTLIGGTGTDNLTGGAGTDTLTGGTGTDTLTGGAGNDVFDFNNGELGTTTASADVIADFTATDSIDLSGIDANAAVVGDQAFTWVSGGTFTAAINSHSGFSAAGGQLYAAGGYLYIDTDTDIQAEYVIRVMGVAATSTLVVE